MTDNSNSIRGSLAKFSDSAQANRNLKKAIRWFEVRGVVDIVAQSAGDSQEAYTLCATSKKYGEAKAVQEALLKLSTYSAVYIVACDMINWWEKE